MKRSRPAFDVSIANVGNYVFGKDGHARWTMFLRDPDNGLDADHVEDVLSQRIDEARALHERGRA